MLKNTKGMTLVEMIVTIAVFSIAALVLAAGFSTVIRYMGEANAIKNTSDEVYAMIESDDNKNLTYEEIYFKIYLDDGDVDNKISRVVAEKGISNNKDAYKVKYMKFSKNVGYVDSALTFYEQVKKSMNYILLNKNEGIKTYNKILSELKEQGIATVENFGQLSNWVTMRNDDFIEYFFVAELFGEHYPLLDQKIVDKCNDLFEETKGLLNDSKSASVKIGERKMYMKFIYIPDSSKPMIFLVADEYPYTPKVNQWKTRLIYNHEDESWYYKIHTATLEDRYSDLDYYYNVAQFNTVERWNNLVSFDFKDTTKWRKIEIE